MKLILLVISVVFATSLAAAESDIGTVPESVVMPAAEASAVIDTDNLSQIEERVAGMAGATEGEPAKPEDTTTKPSEPQPDGGTSAVLSKETFDFITSGLERFQPPQ